MYVFSVDTVTVMNHEKQTFVSVAWRAYVNIRNSAQLKTQYA